MCDMISMEKWTVWKAIHVCYLIVRLRNDNVIVRSIYSLFCKERVLYLL